MRFQISHPVRSGLLAIGLLVTLAGAAARGHDIPNARIDRSIQATVRPGRLGIAYEVSLAELTLTQDLRSVLDGPLPGGDRAEWFDRYGQVVGPLIARGMIVAVNGREVELRAGRFAWRVEEHPIFTFAFDAPIPPAGTLNLRDGNYVASEGTSRLAIRGQEGVTIRGDDRPGDVTAIPIRRVWELSDAEERRTKQVEVEYASPRAAPAAVAPAWAPTARKPKPATTSGGLPGLLGGERGASVAWLGLLAFGLGAAHAVQPGHGKTLVAAATLGRRGGAVRGAILAVIVTTVHMGVVLAIAAALWATRTARYEAIDRDLARVAGFAIAAVGCWRLGRHAAGRGEHGGTVESVGDRGLLGLGVAGGLVPCWDAVLLIVLAEALGRLPLGVVLLGAFGLGMATVLVVVGTLAGRIRSALDRRGSGSDWGRRLGLAGGAVLATIGVVLMAR